MSNDEEQKTREEAHRIANEGNPMNRKSESTTHGSGDANDGNPMNRKPESTTNGSGDANDGNPMNDTGRFNYKHIADEKEKAEDISFEEYLRRQQLNQQETQEQDEKSKTDFRDRQKAQNERTNRDFDFHHAHTYDRGR